MHQTHKGKQWNFGMKAHINIDSKTKMIHTVVATAANLHDLRVLEDLLHGVKSPAFGKIQRMPDKRGGSGIAPQTPGILHSARAVTINPEYGAKVEHVFHIMNRQFGFTIVHYRGLDKNAQFLFVNCD